MNSERKGPSVGRIDSAKILPGGHRWRRCSSCGGWAATLKNDQRCRQGAGVRKVSADGLLTVSCPGRVLDVDLSACEATEHRTARPPCQRTGCGNAGAYRTARGELVCSRCLGELAERPVRR